MKSSTALWYEAQEKLTFRTELLCPATNGEVRLSALWSGVSRGTEQHVYNGNVPQAEWQRMSCPHQRGTFAFPVKYGYGFVGEIAEGGGQDLGKPAFCLHPHQSDAIVPADMVHVVPDNVPPRRAVLAANMETALNIVWDARISIGDRVLVVGAGVVGLLTAWLSSRIPGTDVTVCDVQPGKHVVAGRLGIPACLPADAPAACDVTINASASAAGLRTALAAAGQQSRVVEASWFGTTDVTLPLGEGFHSQRLQIISSQVGHVPPDRQPRWTYRRRLAKAITLLDDPALDHLITHEIDFERAVDELPPLFADQTALGIALRYPGASRPVHS